MVGWVGMKILVSSLTVVWSFWSSVPIQEATKSHFIRTKDTVTTQEILRGLGALCQGWGQRTHIRTKAVPCALITEEMTGLLGALHQELGAEVYLFLLLYIYYKHLFYHFALLFHLV